MKNKNLIRSDQHFLDFPLWALDDRLNKLKQFTVNTDQGQYILTCGNKPPDATDSLFLYSFMKLAQQENKKTITITNRNKILKMCGMIRCKQSYNRLWESLERWKEVSAKFDGCYYDIDKNKHVKMLFGIIDWAKYDEDAKELTFKFNDVFYKAMKEAKLYRLIDLDYYKMLKRPVSRRLYELMKRKLDNQLTWSCEALKLAEKLTLNLKYPSQIIQKLNPAINEINKNTDIEIELDTRKTEEKRTIFTFKKIEKKTDKELKDLKKAAQGCWKSTKGNCASFRTNLTQEQMSPICEYCPGRKKS